MTVKVTNHFKKSVSGILNKIRTFRLRNGAADAYKSKPWLDFYDHDVPFELFVPEITLNDLLKRSVDIHKNFIAFTFYGNKFTYEEFNELVNKAAAGLEQLGVKKGDRVAIILPNSPQFMVIYWAILKLGAIAAPTNPLLTPNEILPCLRLIQPKVVILLQRFLNTLQPVFESASVPHVVVTSIGSFMPTMTRFVYFLKSGFERKNKKRSNIHIVSFDRLLSSRASAKPADVKSSDPAALLLTGGVTGTPKAVLLTHYNLIANTLQTRAWLGDVKDGQEVLLGVLPFFHSYGMTACHHLAIQAGAMIVLEPRFKASRALQLIKQNKVTLLLGVPTMFWALLKEMQTHEKSASSLRISVSGGAPLPTELKESFELWTHSRLVEGYGLTEASPITHCNPRLKDHRSRSIGLPYPNTEARIVHLKSGKPVLPNMPGELQVRGPQIMKEYFENAEETRAILARDGWLSTGDIAKMDADGYFYILDRKKDLILYGGFNVYPTEVETVLNQHPSVKESAVVGIPDEYYGETVKAFVVLNENAESREDELISFCQGKLAKYKFPKQIEFVDNLPKNFIGKILRRQLIKG